MVLSYGLYIAGHQGRWLWRTIDFIICIWTQVSIVANNGLWVLTVMYHIRVDIARYRRGIRPLLIIVLIEEDDQNFFPPSTLT